MRDRRRCTICDKVQVIPQWTCETCKALLRQLSAVHATGDRQPKHVDLESRIARYTVLAELGLPLFQNNADNHRAA
jgi:hypothetical protein